MPHVSIYVDESGDVGFKKKSSKFFTIGYVFTINKYPIKENEKIKRLIKNINTGIRNKKEKISELKFSQDTDMIKKKVLHNIQKLDVNIGVICISKDSVTQNLKKDSSMFYRYVIIENIVTLLVEEYLKIYDPYNKIRFTIDRSLSKNQIKAFNDYCEEKILFKVHEQSPEMEIHITILHEDSKKIPMLQVADYVAGATQRKITHCDSTYYDIISDKIKHKKIWDWNNKINFGDS